MRVLQNRNRWFDCGLSGVVLFVVVAAIGATGIAFGQQPAIQVKTGQVVQQRSIDLGSKRQAAVTVQSAPPVQTPVQKKFTRRLPTYFKI